MQVQLLVLLFPLFSFGQAKKSVVQGYLVDEQTGKKLTEILVVNQTSGDFAQVICPCSLLSNSKMAVKAQSQQHTDRKEM